MFLISITLREHYFVPWCFFLHKNGGVGVEEDETKEENNDDVNNNNNSPPNQQLDDPTALAEDMEPAVPLVLAEAVAKSSGIMDDDI